MRDVVGLDLDGVLWNTNYAIEEFLAEEFNITPDWGSIEEFKIETMDFMPDEAVKVMLEKIHNGEIFERALPYNYAEYSVNKLRNEGFDVAIITSRRESLRSITMDLLDEHNIHYDTLHLMDSADKYISVRELNAKAFIEDRFDILELVIRKHKPLDFGMYVINQPYNRQFNNDHIVRVDDVAQAVDKIVEYRKWLGYFTHKCQGNIEKFIKEYQDGKGKM